MSYSNWQVLSGDHNTKLKNIEGVFSLTVSPGFNGVSIEVLTDSENLYGLCKRYLRSYEAKAEASLAFMVDLDPPLEG